VCVFKINMVMRVCVNCGKDIDTSKELYVLLGTYNCDEVVDETYYHMNCWRSHFEDQTKKKAEVIVNNMQERMMPIAKQLVERIKNIVGENGNGGTLSYTG